MIKKIFIGLLTVFIFACSQKEEKFQLEKDSDVYNFAKKVSAKYPKIDPDKNMVLVETNRFYITSSDVFDALFKNFSKQIQNFTQLDTFRIKKIFNENASLLAEKKMILTAAKDEGFEVNESELDSIIQMQHKKAGGKQKFEQYIKNSNLPLNYIYDDYKNSLLIQKFLKDLVKDSVKITDEEIKEKMMKIKSVSVRHILLKTTNLNNDQKRKKKQEITKILKRAKNGEDFSQLAKTYSEDTGTAKRGGLIKNIKSGDMVQPFDHIAFSLAIGELSDIFETQFGYHILTVIDRKKEDRSAVEIKNELKEVKQKQILPDVIQSMKNEFEFKEHTL